MSAHEANQPDRSDAILERILRDLDRGAEPDLRVLREMFPGHEATVDRLCGLVREYRRTLREPTPSSRAWAKLDLKPGDDLGEFVVESRLAEGGMSVVYRARQRSLGMRPVALKVVPDDGDPEQARRFAREALLAASLHHPSLAEVYGFGSNGLAQYYAMQLVEGMSLRDVLEARARSGAALDTSTIRAIVARIAEVAAALECVHDAGLVHRDVKPGNIVLASVDGSAPALDRARATLVDFGLARAVDRDSNTRAEDASSTPAYAAPEQLIGGDVDARVDVFSLGATLHDLLAGRLPQDRAQASAGLEPIDHLAPRIDRDLAAIVGQAVDPVARWRYRNAREFLSDLRAWQAGEPVTARRLSLAERFLRWSSQPRNAGKLVLRTFAVVTGIALGVSTHQWASVVRSAASDWKNGDLVSALSASELPGLVRHAALATEFNEFLDAAASGGAGDVETASVDHAVAARAALHLRSGLHKSAYHEIRTFLEKEGWGSSPLLTGFLAHRLRASRGQPIRDESSSVSSSAPASAESPSAPWDAALAIGIRAPDLESDRSPSTPIRLAAVSRLNEVTYGYSALCALGILAACGTLDTVDAILDWRDTIAPDLINDGSRISLFAIEGILRRERTAHEGREATTTLRPETASRLETLLRRVDGGSPDNLGKRIRIAAIECIAALVQLEGSDRWAPVLEDRVEFWPEIASMRALDGDAGSFLGRIQTELLDKMAASDVNETNRLVKGLACLAVVLDQRSDESENVLRIRGELASNGLAPAALVLFDEEAKGWKDPASRLAESWKYRASSSSGSSTATSLGTLRPHLDDSEIRLLFESPGTTKAVLSASTVLGAWDFRTGPAGALGTANVVHIVDCDPPDPSSSALRLKTPGRSRIELPLASPEADRRHGWTLHLLAQCGSIDYQPYQGRAVLRVRVGNDEACAPIIVTETDSYALSISLRSSLLGPRAELLTIELDSESPSDARIHLLGVTAR